MHLKVLFNSIMLTSLQQRAELSCFMGSIRVQETRSEWSGHTVRVVRRHGPSGPGPSGPRGPLFAIYTWAPAFKIKIMFMSFILCCIYLYLICSMIWIRSTHRATSISIANRCDKTNTAIAQFWLLNSSVSSLTKTVLNFYKFTVIAFP